MPTATPTPTVTPTPTSTPTPTLTPVPTVTPTPGPTPIAEINEDGSIKVTITKGMTSEKFSSNLEKLGIVDDWKALNNYIVRNGYALRIQIGTFTLKKGMSYAQIVSIVASKKSRN